MKADEVELLYAEFVTRIKLALVPEPGDPPSGRKTMEVSKFGNLMRGEHGSYKCLSFVVMILGLNHGFRIEMISSGSFVLRAWNQSGADGVSHITIRVRGDLNVGHLELIARLVAIPFHEERK